MIPPGFKVLFGRLGDDLNDGAVCIRGLSDHIRYRLAFLRYILNNEINDNFVLNGCIPAWVLYTEDQVHRQAEGHGGQPGYRLYLRRSSMKRPSPA